MCRATASNRSSWLRFQCFIRVIPDQSVSGTAWGTAFFLVFSLTPGVVAVVGCGCRRRCAAMGAIWGRYGGGIPSRAGLSHASGKLMSWIKNYELTLSLPVATVGSLRCHTKPHDHTDSCTRL